MKIVIVGCGRVGAGLATTLVALGHAIAVVDTDPLAFEKLGDAFSGRKIVGIGFDREVLLQADILHADALAAVTAGDEANVVVARMAREIFHVPRVVARLFDVRQAEIYRRLGLQTVAPTDWGVHRIAELLLHSPLATVASLGSGEVELIEAAVPQLMVGKMVRDLTVSGEVHVVAITRANRTFLPTLGTIFQPGDVLHIAALASSVGRTRDLLDL